jgi:hypothetical protein
MEREGALTRERGERGAENGSDAIVKRKSTMSSGEDGGVYW